MFEKRKTFDARLAQVVNANKPIFFRYALETPQSFERFNSFIQGMEWRKSTATISTSTDLALNVGDLIQLEDGERLRIVAITAPKVDKRKSMMTRHNVTRRIIMLE